MKKLVLLCGPFSSRSGYGDHARSIFYPIYDSGRYDVKLWDVRWGDTPKTFLSEKKKDLKIRQFNLVHQQLLDKVVD